MRVARIALLAALALVVSAVAATAADVRVLSVGSTSTAARAIAEQFTQATGHQVSFTIRPPFAIDSRTSTGSTRRIGPLPASIASSQRATAPLSVHSLGTMSAIEWSGRVTSCALNR